MDRKLIKQGKGGFTIYLPKKWVDDRGLNAGDIVKIEQDDSTLTINAGAVKEKKKGIITVSNETESSVRTLVTNAYRLGYDIVRVNYQNDKQFKMIHSSVKNHLLGFEITDKENDFCVIESITEPSADKFNVLMQKMFYNVSEIFGAIEAMLSGKKPEFDIEELEDNIKQFDNFCKRVMLKQNEPHAQLFWQFTSLIVHGQRHLYLLSKMLNENKIKVSAQTFNLLEEVKGIFELIKKAYLKKEIPLLETVHALEKDIIYKKSYKLLSEKKGKETIVAYRIASAARDFYLSASPLAGLLIKIEETTSET